VIRHLVVPGLFWPLPESDQPGRLPLPRLERLLARADQRAEPAGLAPVLFDLFGYAVPDDADLPSAAVSLFGETGDAPDGFILHADPLQLIPDRDCLRAFALDAAPLDAEESAELLEAFNGHFGGDGTTLFSTDRGHLYLCCEADPRIRTHPLDAVLGRNLDPFLPEGEGKRQWRGLLNEVQMLCHGLAFNERREALGHAPLGGLWFSGGGVLPLARSAPIGHLVGDDRLARGLVRLSEQPGGDELVVDDAPGQAVLRADGEGWRAGVSEIEDRLPDLMATGEALHVHPCDGRVFIWEPRHDWRIWRRRRSLHAYRIDRSDSADRRFGEAL
jgi:hypothetical protein